MIQSFSLIGFGEAGSTFARAGGWGEAARAYDIKDKQSEYGAVGVTGCAGLPEAIKGSSAILSLVTAGQAKTVAEEAAQSIAPGALYFDMNSVAPDTKRISAKFIQQANGRYIDVAVMAPVHPAELSVPLLLSGADAAEGAAVLTGLGFDNIRVVDGEVGKASSIKMIRSIMVKGIEALTAEMMLAAHEAGVSDDVLQSLGPEWAEKAEYNLERMRSHGLRRAEEMQEVALTLEALGIEPLMTKATIIRQREMANKEGLAI
ncbi:MAG: NAD(P)-dependent oxidoreductase [Sphingomonadales bacterium]|nr:NAD(P)-dependent oxidoreductase [Sphingomonadales bacterium]PIX64574.1 MAG: NAD(P)-dependent oxidoreductase [Sphingomonadales bacterium CG_4_10_14_3_um_filter_58_15]NCO48338.1 NAD(P)-dependent oxidoreductase [Sphingomonadales bacterium]NCO99178.1 NAD(P)-dependent oxidoreductase [Sphingomonadales bacterium]NCP26888.1 NAD(P)-dependent oxidoreductase [Sphingomonadales bacterium]